MMSLYKDLLFLTAPAGLRTQKEVEKKKAEAFRKAGGEGRRAKRAAKRAANTQSQSQRLQNDLVEKE